MKRVLLFLALVALPWLAWAQSSYTVELTLTARQEQAIQRALVRVNAQRADAGQAPITAQQLVERIVTARIAEEVELHRQEVRTRVGQALDTADAATVAQVAKLLGIAVP